ncbi:MAG: Smr/MutS family protein [Spirochaetes bacterium]|jgi:DNA mismatch repair protein MutS2|nr:Smr/MutS family protein [Spirochaetota bacterium]
MNIITEHELTLLEWDQVVAIYQKFCRTESGKALYDSLSDLDTVSAQIQSGRVKEIQESLINELRPEITPLFPVARITSRAAKGSMLTIDEIYQVSRTARTINGLINFYEVNRAEFSQLMPLCNELIALPMIESSLCDAITDDMLLNEKRYPRIKKLHGEIDSLKNEIKSRLQQLVNSPAFSDHVQERIVTTSGNKYVILLKSSSRGKVPGTIIDTSSSGATFYFEPGIASELNARLLSRENELNQELFTIIKELSEIAGSAANEIASNLKIAAKLDFLYAAASAALNYGFSIPNYSDNVELNLIHSAHPLLLTEDPKTTVRNSVVLGKDYNGIIITGANTGGKTILLKSTALLVLLARCGLPIPASPDSTVGNFTTIAVDIGDDQNMQKSLSTFSGQIVTINSMIERCSSSTLLIIDEIISGTNPRHAAALAMSVLEHFETQKTPVIVSTHYPELKEFAAKSNYYTNASVSFDVESLTPTYRLNIGNPGTSYAFEISRIYKLKGSIVDKAAQYLSENEIISDQTIEKVNRLEHELVQKTQETEKLKSSLEKQRENYYQLNEKLRSRIENIKEEGTVEYLKQLDSWKQELASHISSLQQLSMGESQQLIEKIKEQQNNALKQGEKFKNRRVTQDYIDFDPEKAIPGCTLFVTTLEKKARLLEINSARREVLVALGSSMKSRFPFDKVRLCNTSAPEQSKSNNRGSFEIKETGSSPDETALTMQNSQNSIDLRGMRMDEALRETDKKLDIMLQTGIPAAVIIHGHGTGTLKSAIRDYLSSSSFITSFRPGSGNEGGDGVTIAYL